MLYALINPSTPNDPYRGSTAPLTSKRCILYIYSTNIGTEYLKHGVYFPFFLLQNAVCFIILKYLVSVLFTFYIQGVLKFKKIVPAPKCLTAKFPLQQASSTCSSRNTFCPRRRMKWENFFQLFPCQSRDTTQEKYLKLTRLFLWRQTIPY
jgi:hypothetical protein